MVSFTPASDGTVHVVARAEDGKPLQIGTLYQEEDCLWVFDMHEPLGGYWEAWMLDWFTQVAAELRRLNEPIQKALAEDLAHFAGAPREAHYAGKWGLVG